MVVVPYNTRANVLLSACYTLGIWCGWSLVILIKALGSNQCYYLHFLDEELRLREAESFGQAHRANKFSRTRFCPGFLGPESQVLTPPIYCSSLGVLPSPPHPAAPLDLAQCS